jgi:hypothetical protein
MLRQGVEKRSSPLSGYFTYPLKRGISLVKQETALLILMPCLGAAKGADGKQKKMYRG